MIPNSSPAAKHTLCKKQIMRIKDELRFLHMKKKQQINLKLYRLHLSLANTWGNSGPYIQGTIEDKVQRTIGSKYKTLDDKLHRLAHQQTTPKEPHTFFPRVINNTDITFSKNELSLLNKGPKYNLHKKDRHWLTNLALEAEIATNMLPMTDREYHRKRTSDHLIKLKSQNKTHTRNINQSESKPCSPFKQNS